MKKLNKKGFTIVELVIVIAVIAILAGVLIPTFATVVDKANQSKAMQEAKNAYELYLAEDNNAQKLAELNFCITSGKYCFHVTKGQFIAEPSYKAESHTDTESTYKKCTINEGKLVLPSDAGSTT